MIGSMIKDPLIREDCWFLLGRLCGRPIREYLALADPEEDPIEYLQAIQALEGLREDQMWIRRSQNGQDTPSNARWQ